MLKVFIKIKNIFLENTTLNFVILIHVCHKTMPTLCQLFYCSGSINQFIGVYNQSGDTLSTIKYHDGFIGQRIGSITSLSFHPYRVSPRLLGHRLYSKIFKKLPQLSAKDTNSRAHLTCKKVEHLQNVWVNVFLTNSKVVMYINGAC